MIKKGILYGILAAAYGKEEAQKFITHESGDFEKIKEGIKLSAQKAGLSKNAINEVYDIFNPIVKYPIAGSRVVIKRARSILQKILEY